MNYLDNKAIYLVLYIFSILPYRNLHNDFDKRNAYASRKRVQTTKKTQDESCKFVIANGDVTVVKLVE